MAAIAAVAVCVALSAQTAAYSRTWTDNLTFWTYVAARSPDDGLAQRELGAALVDHGQLEEAERALQRALRARSTPEGLAMTYGNLGNLYRRLGRFDDAVTAIESGLRVRQHPGLLHNLGMTLMARAQQGQRAADQSAVRHDVTRARDAFNAALRVGTAPDAPLAFTQEWDAAKTHALLGQVLFALGDRDGARAELEAALRLQPSGPVADLSRQYLNTIPR
jgi:Flp pilus assembly protein TadD